jgi:diguanylate cyclase (GGDEF)-like protein
MRSSNPWPQGARALAFLREIDWHRRDVRDAIILVPVLLVAYVAAEHGGLTDKLFDFARDYAAWGVDDVLVMLAMTSVALIIYGYRRLKDLSKEVKARRAAETEAQKLARHDPLTGLPNRRFFNEKLDEILKPGSDACPIAVLMLDLDGFKVINDAFGHLAGDRALVEFTNRVSAILRPGTLFARLGGDEFGVIATKIASLDGPTALARRIIGTVVDPIAIDGKTISIGVGVGIAVSPDDGSEQDMLMRRADLALYRAKALGRSHVCFFAPDMDAHVERRIRIERELRAAMAADAVVPHYQPLVTLDGNGIVGFEALARWCSNGETIHPTEFIAIAEESGLIGELSDKLLRVACRDATEWPDETTLSFNISPVQLRDPLLGLRILAILGQTGLRPHRLELEITESALVENIEVAQRVIDQLRQAGVRIALDDFGTGYATLSQLLSLHLDKIKIDRSFVRRLGTDPESLVIIRAVIGLANGFGLVTTAEGVENADQLACLKANGCTEGQGYLFGKALPASEALALLRSSQRVAPISAVA